MTEDMTEKEHYTSKLIQVNFFTENFTYRSGTSSPM